MRSPSTILHVSCSFKSFILCVSSGVIAKPVCNHAKPRHLPFMYSCSFFSNLRTDTHTYLPSFCTLIAMCSHLAAFCSPKLHFVFLMSSSGCMSLKSHPASSNLTAYHVRCFIFSRTVLHFTRHQLCSLCLVQVSPRLRQLICLFMTFCVGLDLVFQLLPAFSCYMCFHKSHCKLRCQSHFSHRFCAFRCLSDVQCDPPSP